MLDAIVNCARSTDYDFRETACAQDPLAHRFPDWVPYYKTKWAIGRVLQPASILEIGVRYGYSAAAFLHGSPDATYLGLDLDCDDFGGVKGAIQWARKITDRFSANFLVADSQSMNSFPGGVYDLVHVDGQQDGDGSFHDLELAVRQGRYVLADGFFWTQSNFQAMSYFLYRNRDLIEFYGVIPGYAGELLIKVLPSSHAGITARQVERVTSGALRGTYSTVYYLNECEGAEQFKQTQGKQVRDERLRAVAAIASLKSRGRVLDLGCGRGELAHCFAELGFEVTAIDYSAAAIELAEKCFAGEEQLRARAELICDDVCTAPWSGLYDVIIASDLIERISPPELDELYARIARHLAKGGIFVVHTYPNLWFFKYDYVQRRRIAEYIGAYLPKEPRTRYELLMHINEQSPPVLKKSLRDHFRHVLLWFGEPAAPGGSLLSPFSRRQLCGARDLFAVASDSPIDAERLKAQFRSLPLPEAALTGIKLRVLHYPLEVKASNDFELKLEIGNESSVVLASLSPHPVNISYHWLDEKATRTLVWNGERSVIVPPLSSGMRRVFPVRVRAPGDKGRYLLRLTLVQEAVRWFDELPAAIAVDVPVFVGEA
jgi:2-polyprenyl-3-methyl-5-hydroxy-6-metoxy-1,4-benzoquinol methylase